MNPSTKLQLETAGVVFAASFLTSIGSQLSTLSIASFSWSLLGSLIVTAVGVAARAVITKYFTNSVGNALKTGSIR